VGEDEPQNPSGCWLIDIVDMMVGWCVGVEGSVEKVHAIIQQLIDQGIPSSRIVLVLYPIHHQFIIFSHLSLINSSLLGQGGFSQGGMVALGAGLTWKEKLAG